LSTSFNRRSNPLRRQEGATKTVTRYHVYLTWSAFHLLFVTAVSLREIRDVFAIRPASQVRATNFLRQGINAYLNLAGVENGYGFFAPNVPNHHKLVFELHYANGNVDYDVPHVASDASGLRIASLLDYIAGVRDDTVRRLMVKMVTHSIWSEHPDAVMIRAFFSSVTIPGPSEFQAGRQSSYRILNAYESRFRQDQR
jgi:hypothetical protein